MIRQPLRLQNIINRTGLVRYKLLNSSCSFSLARDWKSNYLNQKSESSSEERTRSFIHSNKLMYMVDITEFSYSGTFLDIELEIKNILE